MQISGSNFNSDVYLNTAQSLNKISSGLSLNSAADDASSLAISDKLQVQASGISQSIENVNSGVAYLQIGDKAMSEQSDILDNIKEKLLQASTDTTSQEGRDLILNDIKKQLTQFNNIAKQTNYNGENILQKATDDTTASDGLQIQAGESSSDLIETTGVQSNTTGVGLEALLNQDPTTFDSEAARAYLDDVDSAISQVNGYRGELGSASNQLSSASANLATQYTNIKAADSVLSNVNYANEVSNFSKQNILAQVGAFGAAQSNNITQQNVLRLLT